MRTRGDGATHFNEYGTKTILPGQGFRKPRVVAAVGMSCPVWSGYKTRNLLCGKHLTSGMALASYIGMPALSRAVPEGPIAQAMQLARSQDRDAALRGLRALAARHPADGRVRHVLGVTALEHGQAREAVEWLAPLVDAPAGASPLVRVHYANALVEIGRADDAVPLLTAQAREAPSPDAWYALGRALQATGRPADARAIYALLTRQIPNDASAWANLATASFFVGDLEQADVAARRALSIAPTHADAMLNLGVVRLAQQRWHEGWALYEARWRTRAMAAQHAGSSTPRWTGAPLHGTLAVVAEQGLGDTVHGVRWLRALRDRVPRLVLVAPRPLVRWLREHAVADEVVAFGEPLPRHDAHVPLWSVPHVLTLHDDASVYGDGAPYLAREIGSRPSATPPQRVGIAWSGSATHLNDRHRSANLDALAPLWRVPGITWVNLQVDQPDALRHALQAAGAGNVRCEAPLARDADFADTARVLATLDLVISIDSAVAHAAGAIGVPTWILLPRIGLDWRWYGAEPTTPWYDAARCWRQGVDAGWMPVADAMATALRAVPNRRSEA